MRYLITILLFVLGGGAVSIGRVWPNFPNYGIALWKKHVNETFRKTNEELEAWLINRARIGPYYPLF